MAHFTMPKHVLTGENAIEEAGAYFENYGKKALIVSGKHVGKSPMMDRLVKLLKDKGIMYTVFDGITGEPTVVMIEKGKNLFIENDCEFCIGIGGGSPLDSAKAIVLMSHYEGRLQDFIGKEIVQNIPPVIAIPTTSGTGSEVTKFTVITDESIGIKMLLTGEVLLPQLAVVDPDFSMDMPKSVTAATGLDALTHAIEAYTSKRASAMTDVFALSAVKRIMKNLPRAYKNGYDKMARQEMSMAALEAGVCINNSSVTLVHGMSRPVGALFHVPHGISNAMLLKECLRFALDGAVDRFANLAYVTGAANGDDTAETAAEKFLNQIGELCSFCKIPMLKEYGIDKETFMKSIPKMAEDAIASGSPGNTRKQVKKEDCEEIYWKVYEQTRQGS